MKKRIVVMAALVVCGAVGGGRGGRYVVMDDLYYESWGYRLLRVRPEKMEMVVGRIVGGC